MEDAIQVCGHDLLPGAKRHGPKQHVFVAAGVIDQHIDAAVLGEDFRNRPLPTLGAGHVQCEATAAVGICFDERVGVVTPSPDRQPDAVGRRLLQECLGDSVAQAAIGSGD